MRSCTPWLAAILTAIVAAPVSAQRPPKQPDNVKEGSPAPDFTLQDMAGKRSVKLSELKGKPVVLIFGSCT